jgi:thioredoxin reductase
MKPRFVGRVPTLLGYEIRHAEVSQGRARLELVRAAETIEHVTDHVIAATGYRVDARRLAFLDQELRGQLRSTDHVPVLSERFESSIPGLYLVGMAAMYAFGPMMRFACGAEWTARRLTRTFARRGARAVAASLAVTAPTAPAS